MMVRWLPSMRFFSMHWRLRLGVAFFLLLLGASYIILAKGEDFSTPLYLKAFAGFCNEIALSFLVAGSIAGLFLALAAWSSVLRCFVASLSAFFMPLPVTAFLSIFMIAFPPSPFLIGLVGGFGLIWRAVYEILLCEKMLPAAYFKTATSLRLTRWNIFWSLRVPVFSSALWRGFLKDIPDFWVRLSIAGIFWGDFGKIFSSLKTLPFSAQIYISLKFILVIIVVITILLVFIIKPIEYFMKKYDNIMFDNKEKDIAIPAFVNISILMMLIVIISVMIDMKNLYIYIYPFFCTLLIVVTVLVLTFFAWFLFGSLLLNRKKPEHILQSSGKILALWAAVNSLPPLIPFYSILGLFLPVFVPVFLIVQASFAASFFLLGRVKSIAPFIKTGFHLRFSFWQKLHRIFYPMFSRPLMDGLVSIYALLWNIIFLIDIYISPFATGGGNMGLSFLKGGFHHVYGTGHGAAQAIAFFATVTAMSMGLLFFVLYPVRDRFSRKYEV